MNQIKIFLLSLLFSASLAYANPVIIAPTDAYDCQLTPSMANANARYPGKDKVEKSNKLIRAASKAVLAKGDRLFFMGKVMDDRCVPVDNAHIELWQANTEGDYRYASKGELMSPSGVFAGSGTTTTNNLGEFQFDTIFPGPVKNRAPRLHVRITHPDLVPLTTELYFNNDRRNIDDKPLMALNPDLRQRLMLLVDAQEISPTDEGLRAYIELVMRGKEKFSEY